MGQALDRDPWLGTVQQFPQVLHARASLQFDIATETFQKTLFHCLMDLQKKRRDLEISLSDHPGYQAGTMQLKVGVGNNDGFDILDANEVERVMRRITEQGVFPILDFSLDLRYRVQSLTRHRVAGDRYLVRFTFQVSRAEILVHHLQGLRRIDPGELVRLLLSVINARLVAKGYGEIELTLSGQE